jgi:hypothetical protein
MGFGEDQIVLVLVLVLETEMLESGLVVSIAPNQRFLRAFSANRFFLSIPRARKLTLGLRLFSASRLRLHADTPTRLHADTPSHHHLQPP